jgi:cytochrome c oxidase subunit 3
MAAIENHGESHPAYLAHHFHSMKQQFDSGKLGLWLFLATEVLFFGGLFCAYVVYRAHHPEIFSYAHHFLDTRYGAINTVVLIVSSVTIAWAIRCVQMNQRKLAVALLAVTFLCGATFMCIKYIEYSHKFHELWGQLFNPSAEIIRHSLGEHGAVIRPANVHLFFGIYFCMTGLHGIHVVIGMGLILWMLIRTARGEFNQEYFGPVEYTGLYWHLVDLIWIYLFPLLYLIH